MEGYLTLHGKPNVRYWAQITRTQLIFEKKAEDRKKNRRSSWFRGGGDTQADDGETPSYDISNISRIEERRGKECEFTLLLRASDPALTPSPPTPASPPHPQPNPTDPLSPMNVTNLPTSPLQHVLSSSSILDLDTPRASYLPNTSLHLEAGSKEERDAWIVLFNIYLETSVQRGKSVTTFYEIPQHFGTALIICLQWLVLYGTATVGVFRLEARAAEVTELQRELILNVANKPLDESESDQWRNQQLKIAPTANPLAVAQLVKVLLRRLPETLLTNLYYNEFTAAADEKSDEKIQALVPKLPFLNRWILENLVFLCHKISTNPSSMMTVKALALMIGPNILPTMDPQLLMQLRTSETLPQLFELLINKKELLFGPKNIPPPALPPHLLKLKNNNTIKSYPPTNTSNSETTTPVKSNQNGGVGAKRAPPPTIPRRRSSLDRTSLYQKRVQTALADDREGVDPLYKTKVFKYTESDVEKYRNTIKFLRLQLAEKADKLNQVTTELREAHQQIMKLNDQLKQYPDYVPNPSIDGQPYSPPSSYSPRSTTSATSPSSSPSSSSSFAYLTTSGDSGISSSVKSSPLSPGSPLLIHDLILDESSNDRNHRVPSATQRNSSTSRRNTRRHSLPSPGSVNLNGNNFEEKNDNYKENNNVPSQDDVKIGNSRKSPKPLPPLPAHTHLTYAPRRSAENTRTPKTFPLPLPPDSNPIPLPPTVSSTPQKSNPIYFTTPKKDSTSSPTGTIRTTTSQQPFGTLRPPSISKSVSLENNKNQLLYGSLTVHGDSSVFPTSSSFSAGMIPSSPKSGGSGSNLSSAVNSLLSLSPRHSSINNSTSHHRQPSPITTAPTITSENTPHSPGIHFHYEHKSLPLMTPVPPRRSTAGGNSSSSSGSSSGSISNSAPQTRKGSPYDSPNSVFHTEPLEPMSPPLPPTLASSTKKSSNHNRRKSYNYRHPQSETTRIHEPEEDENDAAAAAHRRSNSSGT